MSSSDNSKKDAENNKHLSLSPDYAVALQYNADKANAPIVVAKGQGEIAQKIIELAELNDIKILADTDLLQVLKAVDINEEIPTEAFVAVAEIISYIYKANEKMKNA